MNINNIVDVTVFAGQSNMSGRGNAAEAPYCGMDAGFEYKAVSNPAALLPITEPFGLNEDKAGAIDDRDGSGGTKRRGSLVSCAVNEYYRLTKRQTVAVSASVGGTSTEEWKNNYIIDAAARLDMAVSFLNSINVSIGHIFVVWCQGETDGDLNFSADRYIKNTVELFEEFKKHGAEKCFLIQTGHFNYIDYPESVAGVSAREHDRRYGVIRAAQEELCAHNKDFILAGSFKGHIKNMIDEFHYNQTAYNEVGKNAGRIIAEFVNGSG